MKDLLPFIVAGVVTGAVYGLSGVGLVITYKTSGIFNFANGAIGTLGAYVFYILWVEHHVPWPAAAVCATVVLSIPLGLGFGKLSQRLTRREVAYQVVATVGIALLIQSGATIFFSNSTRQLNQFLPTSTFELGGTNVEWSQLITLCIALVSAGGLFAFLRFSRAGKSMRAVVDDPDLLDLSGISPSFVRSAAWVIGCSFATLSGLLIAPTLPLDPTALTLLAVQAFGAAAIGRFVSLPWTMAGGLFIGLGSSILSKYLSTTSIWAGLTGAFPFVVLFLVLLFAPRSWSLRRGNPTLMIRDPAVWRVGLRFQLPFAAAVLAFFLFVPAFTGFRLFAWSEALAVVILLMSLALLSRLSGQVSLCQAVFAAVGAVALAKFVHVGVPWLIALLLAGVVAVPIGAIVAIPAIRHGGLFLALATFGLAAVAESMFYETWVMFGNKGTGINVPGPKLKALGIDGVRGQYYVILLIGVVIAVTLVLLERGRIGRLLAGLRDSPGALMAGGTNVNLTRLLVFCISAFIAAIAGGLFGVALTNVDGSNSFPSQTSLLYFAAIMVTVGGTPWNALLPGLGLVLVPLYIHSPNTSSWLTVVFGASAVLIGTGLRGETPARVRRFLTGGARRDSSPSSTVTSIQGREVAPAAAALRPAAASSTGLRLSEVTVDFGGFRAVDGVTLTAPLGQITGLIGPNGAGKTTLFNVCSGLIRPSRGLVELSGTRLSGLSVSAIARHGLGRTFQHLDLFESMTVRQNVALGCESGLVGADVGRQMVCSRREGSPHTRTHRAGPGDVWDRGVVGPARWRPADRTAAVGRGGPHAGR